MTAERAKRARAARVLGLPKDFERHLCMVPATEVVIEPEDVATWTQKHRHREVSQGAIGGALLTILCHTSLGDITHKYCTVCREQAYVRETL